MSPVRDALRRLRIAIPHRQVTLFLLAIVAPSVVLVAMAAWMTAQDRELGQKRARDERQRQTEEIRQTLLGYLERLKLLQLAARRDRAVPAGAASPVVLVARIDRDRLVLPWDEPSSVNQLAADPAVAAAIADGEREELIARQPARAAVHYAGALAAARSEGERGYARLLVARAWTKAGRTDRAAVEYRTLFALASDVKDEHGVPMWAYAAQRLAASGDDALRAAIVARIAREVGALDQTTPASRYLLRDLLDRAAPPGRPALDQPAGVATVRQQLEASIQSGEQAARLQASFPVEALRDSSSQVAKWIVFGQPQWLVTVVGGAEPMLIAVSAQAAIDAAVPRRLANVRLLDADAPSGEWIGDGFAAMKVDFVAAAEEDWSRRWPVQRWFAWVIVLLSLTMTAFGGHFLWRDVRRELHMASMRSQFVSSVSHELKTPLTAIRMFAETLRLGRAANEETAAEYLDTIVNESERLTRLLNNVLEFSKMERGTTHFRLQPTPLHEPIRRVIRAMSYPLEQQGFTLNVTVSDSLPRVLIDPDAIEQALLNLLANAMKYSGEARQIALDVRAAGGGVEIAVTDHGIGIPSSEQQRVFEKFYRASTPENRHIPGTGLGLTLVDHIARAHGGFVQLTSAVGRGSTFALVLPAAPPEAGAAPTMAPADAV